MKEITYYHNLQITNIKTGVEKYAYLASGPEIELLFSEITIPDEQVEFTGIMRFNPNKIDIDDLDFEDEQGQAQVALGRQLQDDNIIEITSIKKVKV